jgi:hypothetical protein
VVAGAAQALLHPEWSGNALIVGGPGQGKSTLLQFICQFHRARFQGAVDYTGAAQGLNPLTEKVRVPIRLDLRDYAQWASEKAEARWRDQSKGQKKAPPRRPPFAHVRTVSSAVIDPAWPELERYLQYVIRRHSGDQKFGRDNLTTLFATESVLLALDGLDEVANLEHRDIVAGDLGSRAHPAGETCVTTEAGWPGRRQGPAGRRGLREGSVLGVLVARPSKATCTRTARVTRVRDGPTQPSTPFV